MKKITSIGIMEETDTNDKRTNTIMYDLKITECKLLDSFEVCPWYLLCAHIRKSPMLQEVEKYVLAILHLGYIVHMCM